MVGVVGSGTDDVAAALNRYAVLDSKYVVAVAVAASPVVVVVAAAAVDDDDC